MRLINNTVLDNVYGILGTNDLMRNNTMAGNKYNFKPDPLGRVGDIDTSNTVDGKPIYYLAYAHDLVLDSSSNAGIVCCYYCRNITIKDLNLENNGNGIYLSNTHESKISNNTISNNEMGIALSDSDDNTIYNNYFNNTENVHIWTSSVNVWNITETLGINIIGGPYIAGNYWSDYGGVDANRDGIGDSPYIIDEDNIDYLPLQFSPIIEIEALKEYADGLDASRSTIKSLNTKLDVVIKKLDKGDTEKAIEHLGELIDTVDEMMDKGRLTDEQANDIIDEVESIIEMIQNSEG